MFLNDMGTLLTVVRFEMHPCTMVLVQCTHQNYLNKIGYADISENRYIS